MENIPNIMSSSSSKTNAVLAAVQKSLQSHFTEAHSSTSAAENTLQTMFQGNYITGGFFNINLAPTKIQSQFQNWGRKRRIIESDSSGLEKFDKRDLELVAPFSQNQSVTYHTSLL